MQLYWLLSRASWRVYFLKTTTEENTTERHTRKIQKITDFDSLSVEKISKYPDKETVDQDRDDEWQLESNKELKLNSSRVRSIAIRMSSIFPEKEIENLKDLSV